MTREAGARLAERDGIVFVTLRGDPYHLGLQHGGLLADRIRLMRRTLYDQIIFRQGRLFGLGFLALARAITRIMERHISPSLKDEMRGVADGSGVPYHDVLFFNCFDDLLHALVRLGLMLPTPVRRQFGMACSCFAASGPATTDGKLLIGRNLDYYLSDGLLGADGLVTRTMKEHLVCYQIFPDRGAPFLSVGWPGCIGVVTGINARGLGVACLTSALPGQTAHGTPLPLLYRTLVQHGDSLDFVHHGLNHSRRTIGNNLVAFSSTERRSALFEFSTRQVRRIEPREGWLASTNHFQDPDLAREQSGWVFANSVHRHDRLRALCASSVVDAEGAMRRLSDCIQPADSDGEPFNCLLNPGTIYSVVVAPEESRMWLRAADRPCREWASVDLSSVFEPWASPADLLQETTRALPESGRQARP